MASEVELSAMRRAIALSAQLMGTTNPNPCVGAVVLDPHGTIVGDGVTQPAGADHAEVGAIRAAGKAAQGGTIVVTLEPCRHTGRTQPCTDVIVEAGITRVVFALDDPHQAAAGGAAVLRNRGVDVESDVLADDASAVLGRWIIATARRRPHVTWKYAASLDGRVAAADGTSQWITGEAARRDVHRERFLADAIMVGIGTVLADDPELTVRDWPAPRQPVRVVVDSDARTPPSARVLNDAAPTLITVADDADAAQVDALVSAGADVVRLARKDGYVDLRALLSMLFDRSVALGYLEGGPTLAAAFVREGLVDRVVGYHAPMLLGAGRAISGDLGIPTLSSAIRLTVDDVCPMGDDVRIDARITSRSS